MKKSLEDIKTLQLSFIMIYIIHKTLVIYVIFGVTVILNMKVPVIEARHYGHLLHYRCHKINPNRGG